MSESEKNPKEEYESVLSNIREIRPRAEGGDPEANEALDLLEERLSQLAREIAENEGITDPYKGDPLLEKWEELWKRLRETRNKGGNEDPIWEEIKETVAAIEARKSFSKN